MRDKGFGYFFKYKIPFIIKQQPLSKQPLPQATPLSSTLCVFTVSQIVSACMPNAHNRVGKFYLISSINHVRCQP